MPTLIRPDALPMCYDRFLPSHPKESLSMPQKLVLYTSKMWDPGDTLTVSFIGGSAAQRQHVIDAAGRLMAIANLKFDFMSVGAGTLRIAFNQSLGAWSYIAKDALGVSRSQPTMNLGFDQGGTYTHELVHALGAIHEHQSPFGNPIIWNKPQVYHDLSGPPNNWDQETIDSNMFATYSESQTNGTQFDAQSVMLYSFPASWTLDGFHVDANAVLSDLDKSWLATKYPGVSVPPPPPPPPPIGVLPARTMTGSARVDSDQVSFTASFAPGEKTAVLTGSASRTK